MATCCFLGRNRGMLISVGLVGTLFVLAALAAFLGTVGVVLVALAPLALVWRAARVRWQGTARMGAVTFQVACEKLGQTFAGVAPQARCRASAALMRVNPGVAGFVFRHFVGLTAAAAGVLVVAGYLVIRCVLKASV